jgi:hypothetical protein
MKRVDRRADPGWLLVLSAGVAFAIAAGAGRPGAAAPLWSIAALGALVAVAGFVRPRPAAAIAGAGLAAGLASAVLIAPGFPLAHDLPLHVWTLESFGRAVAAGDWNPRFHLAVGLGTPLGLFYPPLPFWFGVPFYALGWTPAGVAKGALVALHVAGAASMAGAVVHAGRPAAAAFWSGVVYALAPYLLFDLHGRGALGEAAAAIFLPWAIAGVDRALRGAGGLGALAIAGAGIANSHALTLLMLAGALPGVVLVVLAASADERAARARRGIAAGAALALGVATGAHWLVPALIESRGTSLATVAAGSPGARYADFAPPAGDLFERRAVDHFVGSLPRVLRQPGGSEMPYYFGIGLMVAACAGARGARARPGDLFAASLLGVGLVLCIEPAASVWGRVEALARVQYPWRHLLLATPAAAWLAGTWIASAQSGSRAVAALAAGALVADALPYLGVPVWADPPERIVYDETALAPRGGVHAPLRWDERPLRCEDLLLPPADRRLAIWKAAPAYPEYLPPALLHSYHLAARDGDRAASLRAGVGCQETPEGVRILEGAPLVESRADPGRAIVPRVVDRGDEQTWEFAVPVQGPLRLRVAAFPGFSARDAEGRAIAVAACEGWLCVDVPEPTRAIELAFGATPARRAGAWVAAAAALALALGAAGRRRAR